MFGYLYLYTTPPHTTLQIHVDHSHPSIYLSLSHPPILSPLIVGIIPRAFADMVAGTSSLSDATIEMSLIEVHNKDINDLLSTPGSSVCLPPIHTSYILSILCIYIFYGCV